MSMMVGYARGGYCLGFTNVQIMFVFGDRFVHYLLHENYVLGTHYYHSVDKILTFNDY